MGFFRLGEFGTTPGREAVAGLTTFLSMAYILVTVPGILSTPETGMMWGAVFLASAISSAVGTLVMALYANVPYALAPGLGMASFLTVTVCGDMGFTWQEGLSMVFLCGLVNIFITLTNVRRRIIAAIPRSLQLAISGGIGLFLAYVGLLNSGLVDLSSGTPAMGDLAHPAVILFLAALILCFLLYLRNVKGAPIVVMVVISLAGIPLGVTQMDDTVGLGDAFSQLCSSFGAIFTSEGIPSLFSGTDKIALAIVAIVSFSLVDTFDTIGSFVGTGRKAGIFTEEELTTAGNGRFETRMDRALVADSVATSVGAVLGTSNTTTVIESVVGITQGGRTGLTSVVTAICIILVIPAAALVSAIPAAAYSAVLVMVGLTMISSFRTIEWDRLEEAIPAFFAGLFMALCYNISYGIGLAFITFCLTRVFLGRRREISPIMWAVSLLFAAMFVLQALVRSPASASCHRHVGEQVLQLDPLQGHRGRPAAALRYAEVGVAHLVQEPDHVRSLEAELQRLPLDLQRNLAAAEPFGEDERVQRVPGGHEVGRAGLGEHVAHPAGGTGLRDAVYRVQVDLLGGRRRGLEYAHGPAHVPVGDHGDALRGAVVHLNVLGRRHLGDVGGEVRPRYGDEPDDPAPGADGVDDHGLVVAGEDEDAVAGVDLHGAPQGLLDLLGHGVHLVDEDDPEPDAVYGRGGDELLDPPERAVHRPGDRLGGGLAVVVGLGDLDLPPLGEVRRVYLQEVPVHAAAQDRPGDDERAGGLPGAGRPRQEEVRHALLAHEGPQPLDGHRLADDPVEGVGPVLLHPDGLHVIGGPSCSTY